MGSRVTIVTSPALRPAMELVAQTMNSIGVAVTRC
jgi:hypothetical protein